MTRQTEEWEKGGKREEGRKLNWVTTGPGIETNYACGSNLRRRKYASNAFKVNCISLCRARIVCSSPRCGASLCTIRENQHAIYTHMQNYKKRRNERGREGKKGRMGKRASDGAR